MPPTLPSRRARALLATTIAVALALLLGACQPPLTLATFEQRIHVDPLADLHRWWVGEQAALHRVPRSTVERWVAEGSRHLDDAASRSGAWDLSTDGCSFAPDAGPVFDFRWPCIRHDLAWRNLKRLDRQRGGIDTRLRRLRANDRFLADMGVTCRERPVVQRAACLVVAAAYAEAVDVAA